MDITPPFIYRNALPLLDTPGEWYHDIRTQRLYYLPRADENMQHADIEVPALETLVSVDGIEGKGTVSNVTFRQYHLSAIPPGCARHCKDMCHCRQACI
jgi:hypothetical protein